LAEAMDSLRELVGKYASFVTVALAAMTTGRKLSCSYLPLDKYRVNQMSIRQ
jgi:hypothetical protein